MDQPLAPASLFRALVGRAPSPQDTGDAQGLLYSEAFLRASGQRPNVARGVFVAERSRSLKIGVISNCQGPELARWIALATPASTVGVEVMDYAFERREAFLRTFEACDWILVAPFHSDRFRGLSALELEADLPARVLTIPSINFSGLQPDIVQLGSSGARLPSLIGSHSSLVVSGYLQGLDVESTLSLFRPEGFRDFGLFDQWALSEAELRERDRPCDVKIAGHLMDLCRKRPAMLTENHPDSTVYLALVRSIAGIVGLSFIEPPCAMLPTSHALSTAWPVYDAVAEYHRLPYRTTQLYSTLDEVLSRKQFVERSFELYDSFDRATLAAAARERRIPF